MRKSEVVKLIQDLFAIEEGNRNLFENWSCIVNFKLENVVGWVSEPLAHVRTSINNDIRFFRRFQKYRF